MHYDYLCHNCGHQFETEQRITDSPLTKCEKCGKETLERMISGGAGVLTGGSKNAAPMPGPCSSCNMEGGACPYSQ